MMYCLSSPLYNCIEFRRFQRGFSVHALAVACGVSDQTIYNIESGRSQFFGADIAYKICLSLGFPFHQVFSFEPFI